MTKKEPKNIEVKSDKTSLFCSMLQLRTPNCYLERIDERIRKNPHLNRTQWIMDAIVSKLEQESKNE